MATTSDLEYDAETMYDQMYPDFEVQLLGHPSKLVRRIIKDDGNETVAK